MSPHRTVRALPWAAALLIAAAVDASALPRYSARYGQDCQLCHHDPSGGELRSLYATQYLVPTELAWRSPDLETIDPQIGERFLAGLDLRTLFVEGEQDRGLTLQMQSDLYLAVQMDDRRSVVLELGQGGAQQAYGLAYFLPGNGYLRAGRFVPAYGWSFADHQMLSRRHVLSTEGTESPRDWESTGLELGSAPGPWRFTASVGGPGQIAESWTARAVVRESLGWTNLAVGGSFLRRPTLGGHRRVAGVFGAIGFGPLTWLAQWDEPRESGRRERVWSQELAWEAVRGWSLRFTYGFHDPDRDRKTGARRSWGAGLDLLATPFFDVLCMVRYDDVDRGPGVGEDRVEADVVLHFLY